MKARLRCRNVRSVLWAVEKVPAQTDVTYGKSRVIIVISKSSFFPEEQKRRISRGYCRDDRPRNVYWVIGPVQRHLAVRGQVNINVEVRANEWRKVFGHEGSRRWSEDK